MSVLSALMLNDTATAFDTLADTNITYNGVNYPVIITHTHTSVTGDETYKLQSATIQFVINNSIIKTELESINDPIFIEYNSQSYQVVSCESDDDTLWTVDAGFDTPIRYQRPHFEGRV